MVPVDASTHFTSLEHDLAERTARGLQVLVVAVLASTFVWSLMA